MKLIEAITCPLIVLYKVGYGLIYCCFYIKVKDPLDLDEDPSDQKTDLEKDLSMEKLYKI
jgi:hypothetical protein